MSLDISIVPGESISPPPEPEYPDNLWQVMHDIEIGNGVWRPKLPEVFFFEPVHKVKMTEGLQILMFELFKWGAPNLDSSLHIQRWESLYGCHRAFCNYSGFRCRYPESRGGPHGPFANFIRREDLNESLPKLDKPRVCGGATIAGRVSGNYLIVETLTRPVTLEWLIQHPWLFFPATTVKDDKGNIGSFPQADGEPCYVPLIATQEVRYPLKYLRKVDKIADPYKIHVNYVA